MQVIASADVQNINSKERVSDVVYSTPPIIKEKPKRQGRPKGSSKIDFALKNNAKTSNFENCHINDEMHNTNQRNTVVHENMSNALFNPIKDDLYKTPAKRRKPTNRARM